MTEAPKPDHGADWTVKGIRTSMCHSTQLLRSWGEHYSLGGLDWTFCATLGCILSELGTLTCPRFPAAGRARRSVCSAVSISSSWNAINVMLVFFQPWKFSICRETNPGMIFFAFESQQSRRLYCMPVVITVYIGFFLHAGTPRGVYKISTSTSTSTSTVRLAPLQHDRRGNVAYSWPSYQCLASKHGLPDLPDHILPVVFPDQHDAPASSIEPARAT